jgi:hypothetical protein
MVKGNLGAGRCASVRGFRCEEAMAHRRDLRSAQEPSERRQDEKEPVHSIWVVATSTVPGTPLASSVQIADSTLSVAITEANLPVAALSLDKLATINDAMVGRCGCDARTNVAVAETGFPAYFIRLDPETKISEVMILPRGDSGIVAASTK